ncbi:TonB-dependent receptor [Glaesserella parasuis]|uniref:TonB-dependent siderophore receptor n=2 Tax=Glaesserella parasuis TaxID=738 RepID=UPI0011F02F84|nr:TonB-dependent receptor [Glaesserella parasuis]QEM87804.1 TonB-dependent receptor [Glaesserella parasuis]
MKAYNISPRTNYGEHDGNYVSNKQYAIGYEFTHKFTDDLTFSQNYRFAKTDKEQFVTYYYGMEWDLTTGGASNTMAKKGFLFADGKTYSHTIDTRLSKEWKSDNISNTLTGGFDYQHSKVDGVYDFPWPATSYHITQLVTAPVTLTDVPVYKDKQRQLGLYLQNQLRLNEKLTVTGGVRRDFVKGHSDIRGTKSENKVNNTTYSAGLMYMTDLGLAPYFSYSESFRPLSGSLDNATNGSSIYKPYEGKQYEVGFKYLPSFINGQISVAYFDLKEKNALVAARSGDVTTMAQVEKQKNRGIEIQADLNITESLSTSLAYSYIFAQSHRLDKPRIDTPLQPNHTYSALVNYAFKDNVLNGLTLGVAPRYTGTTPTEMDGYNNANIRVPARTLVDLMAKYSLSENWETRVNVTNVANKKYISGCSYACFFGEGRKVTANLTYKF